MHRAVYTERFSIEDGHIVRFIKAIWKHEELDVYKEVDNGKCYKRNIYSTMYGARLVAFPGELWSNNGYSWGIYFGNGVVELEEWQKTQRLEFYTERKELVEKEKELICSLYPDFKYVLKKWTGTPSMVMNVLPFWIEHKDIEFLLALGFERIALNKNFYRLKKENKTKVIKWIQRHPDCNEMTLVQIQTILKHNISIEEYLRYTVAYNRFSYRNSFTYDEYKYLNNSSNEITAGLVQLYKDYKNLAVEAGHSLKEKYWRYPSDLHAFHNKVLNEVNKIKAAKDAEEKAKIENGMKNIVKRASKYNRVVNGYSIFVTADMDEWVKQADALHQCIIRCNYAQRVASGREIIVFIQKEGVPIATAEVYNDLSIGQFYADELSQTREGSLPSEEVREVFNQYYTTLEKDIFKKEKEKINA